jgi:hypothetical protein
VLCSPFPGRREHIPEQNRCQVGAVFFGGPVGAGAEFRFRLQAGDGQLNLGWIDRLSPQ